jgi:hypothetical protein
MDLHMAFDAAARRLLFDNRGGGGVGDFSTSSIPSRRNESDGASLVGSLGLPPTSSPAASPPPGFVATERRVRIPFDARCARRRSIFSRCESDGVPHEESLDSPSGSPPPSMGCTEISGETRREGSLACPMAFDARQDCVPFDAR